MRGEVVRALGRWLVVSALLLAAPVAATAQVQMPDPSQMSGVPLPSPELPAGTLTVRVVRGALSNNVEGQRVTLNVEGGPVREAVTDAGGRAEFAGLTPGARVEAVTTLDGVELRSQTITMPPQVGIRVMLFGADAPLEPSEPVEPLEPVRGTVVLGGQSRVIVELGDESLNVFYILEILNTARAPVDAGGPLIFDLPTGANSATLLPGSTEQATVGGTRVTVTGPFAPGTTSLQVAYSLPVRGARVTIEQVLPATLPQLAVAGETTGGVTVSSPQFATSRGMNADGRTFLVGNGPGLAAGETLTLVFDNLPHHARWPRFAALGLATAIVIAGLVIGVRTKPAAADEQGRDALAARRDAGLAELRDLEARRASGALSDDEYDAARARVMGALEDVYAALDARHT